ncbi:hypothetical protein DYGSA30_07940 [Dyella sp. GSA-30]|nr:hypothetical protein DYGSA30_07940 [Dyella sp. GSA-30]
MPDSATFNAELDSSDELFFSILRQVSLKAVSLIPYVGGILSTIGALVIPGPEETPEQRWKRIIDSINSIVDTKITEAIYSLIASDLKGMTDLSADYIVLTERRAQEDLKTFSISCESTFTAMMPRFATKGHEKSLINMYTIAANMHLGLLRDLVTTGKMLGFEEKTIDLYRKKLSERAIIYGDHVDRTVESILTDVANKNPETKDKRNEPLASVLKTKAQYQLTALDIRAIWPYMDAAMYPDKVEVRLDREIFSPLCGSYFDKKVPVPRRMGNVAVPKAPLSLLEIRHYEFIDGMTLNYGPAQKESIGGNGGMRNFQWNEKIPIVNVICEYANAIAAVTFIRTDGSTTPRYGDRSGTKLLTKFRAGYPGHKLSSIRGFGTATGYGNVLSGCVFGFQLIKQTGSNLSMSAIRKLAESAPPSLLPMYLE